MNNRYTLRYSCNIIFTLTIQLITHKCTIVLMQANDIQITSK